jgi:hypothetical protein
MNKAKTFAVCRVPQCSAVLGSRASPDFTRTERQRYQRPRGSPKSQQFPKNPVLQPVDKAIAHVGGLQHDREGKSAVFATHPQQLLSAQKDARIGTG